MVNLYKATLRSTIWRRRFWPKTSSFKKRLEKEICDGFGNVELTRLDILNNSEIAMEMVQIDLRKSVRFGTLRSSEAPGWGEYGEDSAQLEGPVESENQAKLGQNQQK